MVAQPINPKAENQAHNNPRTRFGCGGHATDTGPKHTPDALGQGSSRSLVFLPA